MRSIICITEFGELYSSLSLILPPLSCFYLHLQPHSLPLSPSLIRSRPLKYSWDVSGSAVSSWSGAEHQ